MSSNVKKTNSATKINNSIAKTNINFDEMFNFYARIVKLIILKKDDTDVISKYSTWLKTLRNHPNAELKYDYVKLLIMGLNHPVAVCPFNEYPPAVIDPIEGNWTEKVRSIFRSGDQSCQKIVLNPPIITAVSDDKRQFAAYQKIPNGGLQCFYAQSDEPLYDWFFKYNSLSIPPENASHAIPLDWERSLAGIRKIPANPDSKNFNSTSCKKPSVLTLKEVKFEKNVDPCIILETIQEKIDLVVDFNWNEKSLLTGDTIPGSDFCIDWLIHEHEKTQLEIDEEIVISFDKLYPDGFRLVTDPKLLEGIIREMMCAEENAKLMNIECAKIETENNLCRQLAGNDHKSKYSNHFESNFSNEHLLTPEEYKKLIVNVPESSFTDITRGTNVSHPNFSEKYNDNKLFENYFDQPIINEYAKDDTLKCSNGLMSFTEAVQSFNHIADRAEDTLNEVNDWLRTRKA